MPTSNINGNFARINIEHEGKAKNNTHRQAVVHDGCALLVVPLFLEPKVDHVSPLGTSAARLQQEI
jgi:hypothetical protein